MSTKNTVVESPTLQQQLDREVERRRQAEAALKKNRQDYHQRLAAQTASLKQANEQLARHIIKDQIKNDSLDKHGIPFRALVETMNEGLAIFDREYTFTYVNDKACRLLGYLRYEVIAHTVTEFLDPTAGKAVQNQLSRLKPGKSSSQEVDWCHQSGRRVPTILSVSPLYDGDGGFTGSLGIITDISLRKGAEDALRNRDAILGAVSSAAERFIRSIPLNREIVQEIIERIGQAINVSRVFIFENSREKDGTLKTTQRHEWAVDGIESQQDNSDVINFPYIEGGMGRWMQVMEKGGIIRGHVRDFPAAEQQILVPQGIKSIIAVPIFLGVQWWGFIGFDECLQERVWHPAEIDAIRTAAAIISAVIERERREENLQTTNTKLLKEHLQRKLLSKRLIELLEKDRRHIAMELHDHIGQKLTSCKISLEMIYTQLSDSDPRLAEHIKEIEEKALDLLRDVKGISQGLMPGMLDKLGLIPSLREMFNGIERNTGLNINFFYRNIPSRFNKDKELAVYRIAQEAVTNVLRHAEAKNIFVNLIYKYDLISLSVEDDGVGFDQERTLDYANNKEILGILIMKERAIQFNGELTLESQPGKGTHIVVEIPLEGPIPTSLS